MNRFAWWVVGSSHRPGSSPEWRPEHFEGFIEAEDLSLGEALERIVSGLGEGATDETTIPWDVISQEQEVEITIRPVEPVSERTAG